MLFKQLVLNLIPDNLKDSNLFNDVLSVFVEYIEENSMETIDILNVYDEDSNAYSEIVKMYASNFIDIIESAKKNTTLQEKLVSVHKKYNIDYDVTKLNIPIKKVLNKDNLEQLKNFYQTKGTLNSFQYVYDIFNKLQMEDEALQSESTFDVAESTESLTYDLKTNMMIELYEQFVKPMVHPLGWSYVYSRLVKYGFNDTMFVNKVYDVSVFNIDNTRDSSLTDNYKLNRGHLFETLADGSAKLKNNKPITYPARNETAYQVMRLGKYYDELDLDSEICLVQDPTVVDITTGANGQTGDEYIIITFESGEYLEQHSINPDTGSRSLILYYGDGPNDLKQKVKKDYSPFIGEYGLDIQYKIEYKSITNENITLETLSGFFDTVGTKLFCGCGNGIVSDYNICGTTKISQVTDVNNLVRIRNLNLNPKYQNTRQAFLGFKYRQPVLYLLISLENFGADEYPLNVQFEDSSFTINYEDALTSSKKIIQVSGIYVNEKNTLEQGYSDKEYTFSINSENAELENCSFRLIPNIDVTKKEVSQTDFDFDYGTKGTEEAYSRYATMQYFTDIAAPDKINSSDDVYELNWEYIEYQYFANIGSLSQIPKNTYIKEIEVFDYMFPKYYSNLVGHFKLYDFEVSYSNNYNRLTLDYPYGSICMDDFQIETFKV